MSFVLRTVCCGAVCIVGRLDKFTLSLLFHFSDSGTRRRLHSPGGGKGKMLTPAI